MSAIAKRVAKLRAFLEGIPAPGEIVGRGLEIVLDGREPAPGARENGLLLGMSPRQFTRDLGYVAAQYRGEVRHVAAITPQQIEMAVIGASEPEAPAAQRGRPSEEDLRISRYLMHHGVEVYKMTQGELDTEIYNIKRRHEVYKEKLSESEIDRLATYMMRLEQIKGSSQ